MKKYPFAIFKITLLNSLAYPAEMVTRSGMILVFMLVFSSYGMPPTFPPPGQGARRVDTARYHVVLAGGRNT